MYKERIEEIVDDHYEEGVKKLKIKHIDQADQLKSDQMNRR